jgi:hypothetical protein
MKPACIHPFLFQAGMNFTAKRHLKEKKLAAADDTQHADSWPRKPERKSKIS